MSLFQSKVWWTTKVAAGEEFDGGHLAVGRFGTREENLRVVVGSFEGKIRVYEPREGGFKPQHQFLEKNEGKPILQLMVFKFSQSSSEDMIAVLYSKGFVVYSFHQGQEGLMLKNEARDESIDRLCYNMCQCFVNGEGLLCIQSQEGLLSFYNKSSRTCKREVTNRHFSASRHRGSWTDNLRGQEEHCLCAECYASTAVLQVQ